MTVETERRERADARRLPTVAELRGMSEDELVARHDALAARSGAEATTVGADFYVDELRARVSELQLERLERLVVAIYVLLAVVGIIAVVVVLIAL
jgi:hypothetical protein